MRKKLLDRLQARLEGLFDIITEKRPQTGLLSPSTLQFTSPQRPTGWVWESDAEGRYTWCSEEFETLLGYHVDDLIGRPVHTVAWEPQSARRLQADLQQGEAIRETHLEARSRDGERFTVLVHALRRTDPVSGEMLGYRGVCQLIEARKKESSDGFVTTMPHQPQDITATAPAPIVASWGRLRGFVDEDGVIRELEPGRPSTTGPIANGRKLVVPIRAQDEILGVFEFEQPEFGEEWVDDDRVMVEEVAQQLALALLDARSYQVTQQALEDMREADQLKSQFLANMSHELRTPLNSIIGFSRVILKGIDGPVTETQEEDLRAIYNAGQHLLGLINDILDLSRIEAGKMELAFTEVDLGEIIQGVMSTAVGLVKDKPIELVTNIPEDLPTLQADNIRIRQVLLNLIANAAKFTREGQIAASARLIDRGDRKEILIAVADTGIGIAPQDQKKLFEPFSQVDASPTRATEGSGLGLSITRHLVELHGGRIWVESTPGEGSTFAFTLPLEPPASSPHPDMAPDDRSG